ncbi:MAG: hypothetical protein AAF206_30155 [Bacteroidota bacterium]
MRTYFFLLPVTILLLFANQLSAQEAGRPFSYQFIQAGQVLDDPVDEDIIRSGFFADWMMGWQVHKYIGVGLGAGIAEVDKGYFFPLYADVRFTFNDNRLSPELFLSGGYQFARLRGNNTNGIWWQEWQENYESGGGLYAAGGLGLRVKLWESLVLVPSMGLRFQGFSESFSDGAGRQINRTRSLNRLQLGLGLRF